MNPSRLRRGLMVAAGTLAFVLGAALPASAHVAISPTTSAPGSFELYTVRVPTELADQATIGVEVILPPGFTLDAAESVPGWRTSVRRTGGRPVAVTWSGGKIPADTFMSFQLQGRNPTGPATMTWRAVQRYEHSTVTWGGAVGSENPAPIVGIGLAKAGSVVPADVGGPLPAAGVDDLARSRAAVGIALAILTLGLILTPQAVSFLRRRQSDDDEPTPPTVALPAPPAAASKRPVPAVASNGRHPVASGSRRG